jgi:MFS family permease
LATIVGLLLVDRVGRKPLLYVGLSGMLVSLFLLAGAFYNKNAFGAALGPISIGCLTVYIACFAFSLGTIGWILASEVFPLPVRGRGIAAASFAYGIANFIVAQTFLSLVTAVGTPVTFALYGCFCIIALVFVCFVVPETKGVELESISRRPVAVEI